MKPLLVLLLCFGLLHAETDDAAKHAGVSFVLGYGFGYGIESYTRANDIAKSDLFKISAATGAALSIGLVKELMDANEEGNRFSGSDLAADFAGALTGALLSNYIHRQNSNFTFALAKKEVLLGYRF
jgi:uncharacterized protein YfiM (DUF2279 family)